MDTLTGIKAFRLVVECGSFVAAAEHMDISTPMVSKHVAYAEERLGVRLLNRNSRTLSLTEAGRVYFERCMTILNDLEATELELASLNTAPRGTLRITCPSWFARQRVAEELVTGTAGRVGDRRRRRGSAASHGEGGQDEDVLDCRPTQWTRESLLAQRP
jgi:DNA-binding transcriptional LysR family regulator